MTLTYKTDSENLISFMESARAPQQRHRSNPIMKLIYDTRRDNLWIDGSNLDLDVIYIAAGVCEYVEPKGYSHERTLRILEEVSSFLTNWELHVCCTAIMALFNTEDIPVYANWGVFPICYFDGTLESLTTLESTQLNKMMLLRSQLGLKASAFGDKSCKEMRNIIFDDTLPYDKTSG